MKRILEIPVADVIPGVSAVLEAQGIPAWRQPGEHILQLARDAISIYRQHAQPAGMYVEISPGDFRNVFEGEGLNDDASPVKPIAGASGTLALYAATLGKSVSDEISRLFQSNDFALGSMLDSTASEGAEMAAQAVQNVYRRSLNESHRHDHNTGILRFSPGYCGWDISGQKRLFAHLTPADIGITLNESFLMQPLKSISGVIISGKKEIFSFEDTFPFCRDCTTHSCRERIKSVIEQ